MIHARRRSTTAGKKATMAVSRRNVSAMVGAFTPSIGIIPKGLWGYNPNLPAYQTSMAKAKQLLQSAGYGPGGKAMTLNLTYTQGDQYEQTAASLLKSEYAPLNIKLNVAALGNLVPQLHVHIIARRTTDVAWPRPVWGVMPPLAHDAEEVQNFISALRRKIWLG